MARKTTQAHRAMDPSSRYEDASLSGDGVYDLEIVHALCWFALDSKKLSATQDVFCLRGGILALLFSAKPRRAAKEGQWVLRTPLRFKNPCSSLLSMVLRTLAWFSDPFPPMPLPRWALLTFSSYHCNYYYHYCVSQADGVEAVQRRHLPVPLRHLAIRPLRPEARRLASSGRPLLCTTCVYIHIYIYIYIYLYW